MLQIRQRQRTKVLSSFSSLSRVERKRNCHNRYLVENPPVLCRHRREAWISACLEVTQAISIKSKLSKTASQFNECRRSYQHRMR